MKRRTLISLSAAAMAAPMIGRLGAQTPTTVKWWYHFDNPQATPNELIARFEKENPGIRIQAESIPWGGGNDYYARLYAALVANSGPDCAMVKLANQSRLLQMKALEPLDGMLANWAGQKDIAANLWKMHQAPDGKQYYVPLQYVVLYLYYRTDLFTAAGAQPPKSFDDFLRPAWPSIRAISRLSACAAARAGTTIGAASCWVAAPPSSRAAWSRRRHWLRTAGSWSWATKHKLFPASAPTDGFRQIVDNFKAGRTAMTIHHIGPPTRWRRPWATRCRPCPFRWRRTARAGPPS